MTRLIAHCSYCGTEIASTDGVTYPKHYRGTRAVTLPELKLDDVFLDDNTGEPLRVVGTWGPDSEGKYGDCVVVQDPVPRQCPEDYYGDPDDTVQQVAECPGSNLPL